MYPQKLNLLFTLISAIDRFAYSVTTTTKIVEGRKIGDDCVMSMRFFYLFLNEMSIISIS